jgi:hypothetical protein
VWQLLQKGTADHRLLSVAVSLEASWSGRLVTDPARRLLSLLGKLPDGVAHLDVQRLMPEEGPGAANVLRRRGLAFDEGGRLRTVPPVRHHVEVAHPPEPADWDRVVAHYRELVAELGLKVGAEGGADAVSRLAPEIANLTAALVSGLCADDPRSALNAVHGAAEFARFAGIDLGDLFRRGLEVARAVGDDRQLAAMLRRLGDVALQRSDHEGARARYEEALPLYRRVGEVLGEANCIKSLGNIALERSDHEGVRARCEEALPLYRRVGSVPGEANCIQRLGDVAL